MIKGDDIQNPTSAININFPWDFDKLELLEVASSQHFVLLWPFTKLPLKEQCHEDFAVLGQFRLKSLL